MATRPVSNDKIYDLINSVRLELKSDLSGLRSDFTTLEAGRLTRLEGHYNDLQLKLQALEKDTSSSERTLTNKFLVLGTIGIILLTAVFNFISLWLAGKFK